MNRKVDRGDPGDRPESETGATPGSREGENTSVPLPGDFREHMLDHMPIRMIVKDEQGRYVFLNKLALQDWGMSLEEVRGLRDHDFFPKEFAEEIAAKDREVLETGRAMAYETQFVVRGRKVHSHLVKTLYTDPDSGRKYVCVFVQDVTEIQKTKQELAESESRYRRLMADANDAIIIADAETGRILDANRRAEEFTGRGRDELIGLHQSELHPPEEADRYKSAFRQHAESEEAAITDNLVLMSKDGKRVPVELSAGSMMIEGRRVLQGIFRDIGKRLERENLLKENEKKFRTLFTASPEAVFLETLDGRIMDCNPAAERMSGYSRKELLSMWATDLMPRRKSLPDKQHAPAGRGPGEILHKNKYGRVFPVEVSASTLALGGERMVMVVVRDITARKEMQARLMSQALRDPLTGLANRTLLLRDIQGAMNEHAADPGRHFALLFIDLSRFKRINDSLGHNVGDELLVQVGERVRALAPTGATVARLGGDEFIVLLRDLDGYRQAIAMANAVRKSFALPFRLGSRQIQLMACIGIVLDASGQKTSLDILQSANVALHQAKGRGPDRLKVFHPSLLDAALERLDLENDLASAIEREEELHLNYQPIFHLHRDKPCLCGFEALARWTHPRLGPISPGTFIPVAEDSGLIAHLGMWVLKAACEAWMSWAGEMPEAGDLFLTVNLSAAQLDRSGLTEQVARVLRETGMPAENLKLEITETAIMTDASRTVKKLNVLRALGLTFAIDDFGTGYSSMAYLQRLPIDTLKIDLSFVRQVDISVESLEIVRAIVVLAKALGLVVVAEGVEREQQRAVLAELGCDCGQGFLYARPMPEADVLPFIRENI